MSRLNLFGLNIKSLKHSTDLIRIDLLLILYSYVSVDPRDTSSSGKVSNSKL